MIRYTDKVIKEIGQHIAAYEPERGGALLGIPNSNLITCFIADPTADVTQASYLPSQQLTITVQNIEKHHGLQFKGVIHSHPGDFNSPSEQDSNAFALGLAINPRLSGFIAPIVTINARGNNLDDHELPLQPRGQLTSYIAYREREVEEKRNMWGNHHRGSNIIIDKVPCSIMPLDNHLCQLTKKIQPITGEITKKSNGYLEINGVLFISITYESHNIEIIALFPPDYPITKPFLLLSKKIGVQKNNAEEIAFPWSVSYTGNSQFADICGEKIISFLHKKF